MFVCVLLVLFAFLVVLLGGHDMSASVLYYDADFTELYDTEGEEKENIEDMVDTGRTVVSSVTVSNQNAIPTTLPDDFEDPMASAKEMYDKFNI